MQEKAVDARLEGFLDWTNPGVSESGEEEEVIEMFGLVSSFAARIRKRAARAQGLTALGIEVPRGKRLKLTHLDEEAERVQW